VQHVAAAWSPAGDRKIYIVWIGVTARHVRGKKLGDRFNRDTQHQLQGSQP
jgi:hypothetical protein